MEQLKPMNPQDIIDKYYFDNRMAKEILVVHSRLVRDKALSLSLNNAHLNLDNDFIADAAMLHDVGIFLTNAPEIGCLGRYPYICHGYLGRELLDREGLNNIAKVAERHTGTGLSLAEIEIQNLPLPRRDMIPVSLEEQLICFADKFFSKGKNLTCEIPLHKIRTELLKYGNSQLCRFNTWCELFL
ncbi:MAG: HD domain-containing protein [Cytophagaceae bacterium]|jgi:uncharacterized protein|nr:HD domain-containing protein [Cytophagaceae bacterium]